MYTILPGRGQLKLLKNKKSERHPDFEGLLVIDEPYKVGRVVKLVAWRQKNEIGEMILLEVNHFPKHTEKKAMRREMMRQKAKKEKVTQAREIRRKDAGDLPT